MALERLFNVRRHVRVAFIITLFAMWNCKTKKLEGGKKKVGRDKLSSVQLARINRISELTLALVQRTYFLSNIFAYTRYHARDVTITRLPETPDSRVCFDLCVSAHWCNDLRQPVHLTIGRQSMTNHWVIDYVRNDICQNTIAVLYVTRSPCYP